MAVNNGEAFSARAFIVHCYADFRKDRLYLVGRLEDGRSFAAVEGEWRPSFHIEERAREKALKILASLDYKICPHALEAFDGEEKLLLLKFRSYRGYRDAGQLLERSGISSPDGDLKLQDSYFIQHHIRGPIELKGEARPGRLVDLVFPEPIIEPSDKCSVSLKIASIDIETDVESGTILAAGISLGNGSADDKGHVRVLCRDPSRDPLPEDRIFFHPTEASLLEAFLLDIRKLDPDVLTGWNFLDFDFPRLAERFAFNRIPFNLGRSMEESKFFPPSKSDFGGTKTGDGGRCRSAAALVQGRQVIDALRVFRSGPRGFAGGHPGDNSSFTLEAVSRLVLGEGKIVASAGEEKIRELKELYKNDPALFGAYCLKDAELVLKILGKTDLFRLTMERACLTGVPLDKAWTSVASFERIYGMELHRRGIAPPPIESSRPVSGAAGGTVLEPLPGLFKNVAVFDFRSLYPTIMLSFNIDPLVHARACSSREGSFIVAPNGAPFLRKKGILPELIAEYFAARRRALEAGNEEASFVYKILMNSFYGVLGTPSCRYGRTELAGAITSFAKKWLMFSRDWFAGKGYRVLYGDTDSLFVETSLADDSGYADFRAWGENCAGELNAVLKECVKNEYDLESFMELRFEKPYRRFMIPPVRNAAAGGRGRAKGYGGSLLHPDGEVSVEVKGMEAVRSDYTPLARRIQVELLDLVFSGCEEEVFSARVHGILHELRKGKLDGELVYRKRLSRAPEAYTLSTPPQVKAARALGWKDRRGVIEYVWTLNGPEPLAGGDGIHLDRAALDYDHYAESQVLPAVRSIASAAGWKAESFASPGRDYFRDGQLELDL